MPAHDAGKSDVDFCTRGSLLRRVKRGRLGESKLVQLVEKKYLDHHSSSFLSVFTSRFKCVEIHELHEVRSGYSTDILQREAKKLELEENAPDSHCFSIIFRQSKFDHKTVDFVAESRQVRDCWVSTLTHLITSYKAERANFDERDWAIEQFRKADSNENGLYSFLNYFLVGKLTVSDLRKLFDDVNWRGSVDYAKGILKNADRDGDSMLNIAEFLEIFQKLTEREDLEHLLRLHSKDSTVYFTIQDLQNFMAEIQSLPDVNLQMAESLIDEYETMPQTDVNNKLMGVNGLRRLLQSRWGQIMKADHKGVFMDMDMPLSNYFCNSSHNTYLTDLQCFGEATIEGYINALKKGVRLLELDVHDGSNGKPVITHKRTNINPILLSDALITIKRYAFTNENGEQENPFPVILTLENCASYEQQKVMAELFVKVLGDSLYGSPKDSDKKPMPSPNALRNKFLLRGKRGLIHPDLSALFSLPSVKLSKNINHDNMTHPMDGSASVSEDEVKTFWKKGSANTGYSCLNSSDDGSAFIEYTAKHFVKSYPNGVRQDSSNMNPKKSWLCGVQAVALNVQTAGKPRDLNTALFSVNGNSGYVLKPKFLRKGQDPRSFTEPKLRIYVQVISAQYLPKPKSDSEISDPYVEVQILGVPKDSFNNRTETVDDNGFNPIFSDSFKTVQSRIQYPREGKRAANFEKDLCCPELAILRFVVMDHDDLSPDDFIGEFSIPVTSIRPGYSHVRLNTGGTQSVNPTASLFVYIAFKDL